MVHRQKCEYTLRKNGINASVVLGDYDNIVQDSQKFANVNASIIFGKHNLIDGLEYKIELLSDDEIKSTGKQIWDR